MKRHVISNEKGTTLVELLVAATIMLVIIAAVIAVIRTGTELEISDNHRREARSILTSWLEDNFTHEGQGFPKYREDNSIESFPHTIAPVKKIIDYRVGDGTELWGDLTIKFDSSLLNINNESPTVIPIYLCTAKITWQENTVMDSIMLVKQITQIMIVKKED